MWYRGFFCLYTPVGFSVFAVFIPLFIVFADIQRELFCGSRMKKNFVENSSLVTLGHNHLIYRHIRRDELNFRLITSYLKYLKNPLEG